MLKVYMVMRHKLTVTGVHYADLLLLRKLLVVVKEKRERR